MDEPKVNEAADRSSLRGRVLLRPLRADAAGLVVPPRVLGGQPDRPA